MFIVNLAMQSRCQVLHLISLIQHSQQPYKVVLCPFANAAIETQRVQAQGHLAKKGHSQN